MLEIRLEKACKWTRWPCVICGGATNKDYVIGVAYEDGKDAGKVCDDCIDLGAKGIAEALREHAENLRKWAEGLEKASHGEIRCRASLAKKKEMSKRIDDELVLENFKQACISEFDAVEVDIPDAPF